MSPAVLAIAPTADDQHLGMGNEGKPVQCGASLECVLKVAAPKCARAVVLLNGRAPVTCRPHMTSSCYLAYYLA